MNPRRAPRSRTAESFDVVIVGGRVAGAATALLTARAGLRVLVLERAPEVGTDTLSTHALMRAGVRQLHRWGLLDEVRASGAPAIRRTIVHYGDEAEAVEIKARDGVDSLVTPRRTVLDPILVRAAVAAGAEVRYGAAVTGLLWDGDRVVGVTGLDRSGAAFEARAGLVVGADGHRSLVAEEVGAPFVWQGSSSVAFLYGYWSGFDDDRYEWFYRPTAAAGVIPTNDGQACVWVGAPTDRFLDELRGDLETAFRTLAAEAAPEAVDRLARLPRHGRLRGFPGLPSGLRRPWGPGWALVGDAGSFKDPISAHGITDALRDAELLAAATIAARRGTMPEEIAFAGYESRRERSCRMLVETVDEIASFRWTVAEVRTLLLALSKAMARELEVIDELDAEVAA